MGLLSTNSWSGRTKASTINIYIIDFYVFY